jgi:hypothetical protein
MKKRIQEESQEYGSKGGRIQNTEFRIQESECFAGNPGAAGERRMVKGVQELGSQEEYGMQKNRSQESELRRPNSELRTPNSY